MKIDDYVMVYNEKTGKWYKEGTKTPGYTRKESCRGCGEPYYTVVSPSNDAMFCCKKCSVQGEHNPMHGKTHSDASRVKCGESYSKAKETFINKYGVAHNSQIDDVKKKKGQVIITDDHITKMVTDRGDRFLGYTGHNTRTIKISLECANGHQYDISYNGYNRGCGCIECFYDSLRLIGLEDLDGFKYYQKDVYKRTMATYRRHRNTINPFNLKRGHKKGEYQLDHKYSIFQGFVDKVPSEVLSSIHNLEMLEVAENVKKSYRCSITLEELMERYNEHI